MNNHSSAHQAYRQADPTDDALSAAVDSAVRTELVLLLESATRGSQLPLEAAVRLQPSVPQKPAEANQEAAEAVHWGHQSAAANWCE